MSYYRESKINFIMARLKAEAIRPAIKANVCTSQELPALGANVEYYLSADSMSGFALVHNEYLDACELISVFSAYKGRGNELLDFAEKMGANLLDCFDGFLVEMYRARGWVEYNRVMNYDGPDLPEVVYMSKGY